MSKDCNFSRKKDGTNGISVIMQNLLKEKYITKAEYKHKSVYVFDYTHYLVYFSDILEQLLTYLVTNAKKQIELILVYDTNTSDQKFSLYLADQLRRFLVISQYYTGNKKVGFDDGTLVPYDMVHVIIEFFEYMQDKYKIAIFFGKKCYMNGYIKYNLTDFLFSVFKYTKSGRLLQKCDVPSSMLII